MIANLQAHYGFTTMPFGTAIPVPALFSSAAHKEAVARLRWLIGARGLGVITGEVGAGKTVAVRAAASGLDPSRHTLIYLPNPQIGVRGLHGAVATALGQAPRFYHATLIPQVEAALAAEADEKNRHVIVAVDEAHLLSHDQLEAIRMMTNSGIDYQSPATIVLIGQPTLRRRLRVGDMAALDQRIQLRYHIPAPPLAPGEADGYLRAHLALAGRSDTLFSDDAVRAIHAHARGTPRAINRLALTALLAACTAGKTIVDESAARTAVAEDTATD
ncbi:MAG TPA: AAA family ATPase [Streptosporangiaceae bacterium]|nr:AAA family ATPase [Streptosporangiaceae bacterium]